MEPALLCSCAAQLTDAAAAVNLNLDRRLVNFHLCIMIMRTDAKGELAARLKSQAILN